MSKLNYMPILLKMLRERGWPTPPNARRYIKAVDLSINIRVEWQRRFIKNSENGIIAICRSGMDCDCTQYRTVTHMATPVSLMAWVRDEDSNREWLDGPETTWVAKPSDEPEGSLYSDRAMAAHEDGHPGRVTLATMDEMRPTL